MNLNYEKKHLKKCSSCQQEFEELYDSYTHSCPECHLESNGTLINADGIWIWESK